MQNVIQNKKIAHIVCSFPPNKDGTGNSAYQTVKNLAHKYDITVLTPFKKTNLKSQISNQFKIERLQPLFSIGNASFLPQLLWRLCKFDIVHLHYPFYGAAEFVALVKLFRGRKMKLIIHYHQDAVGCGLQSLIFKFYQFVVLPILLRQSFAITCATLSYIKCSDIAGYYKKKSTKFKQTYFGVNSKLQVAHSPVRSRAQNSKIILFVGGLDKAHYFKGVDILLKAVQKLQITNYKLQIVGDGDEREKYEKLAEELGIADKVQFLGKIDDKKLIICYSNCNIFVLPSINKVEAFGLVLLEAMAFAKPVIASRLPGVKSVFDDCKQGFFVNPGDINDLTKKINLLLSNDDVAVKMGKLGQKLVKERYCWQDVAKRIEAVY